MTTSPLNSKEFKQLELKAQSTSDYSDLRAFIEPLATNGNPEAQCYLGTIYHLGLGTSPDAQKAIKWYTLSAQQEYALASNNLSSLYMTLLQDPELASHWRQLSIKQGFPS